ncbi:MAG: hypothetical protein IH616_06425 [Gemmatimonadales bacterium]|nr:hypothetical protein [Gemmatimonadales bacterium]
MNIRRIAVALVGLGALLAGEAAAQSRFGWGVTGLVALPSLQRDLGTAVEKLSGTTFGGGAHVRYRFVELGLRYLQGSIEDADAARTQDLVEGAISLHVRPIRPLSIGFGPRARSYVEDGGTERWLTWDASLGLDTWLFPRVLRSALEISLAFGGSVSGGSSIASGKGVEGSLDFRIPRTPVLLGVAYRVDQVGLDGDIRTDTVEQFVVRVSVGQ